MSMKARDNLEKYPALQDIFKLAGNKLAEAMRVITVQPGMPIYQHGQACENFLLILSGSVRVQKLSERGQVITLYHLVAGRACELTTTCLLGGKSYPAEAVAETEVHAILIPKVDFQEALAQIPEFRNFVFSSIDKGMNELIGLVEDVSFGRMDARLARRLLQLAETENPLEVTHQTLAEELGTAREVISRLLKGFERQKWVKLSRGVIEIVDWDYLRKLAQQTR
jgi:CRP/FNR family transcriptional regulator, anaerobic regulatory protein